MCYSKPAQKYALKPKYGMFYIKVCKIFVCLQNTVRDESDQV